MSWCSAPTLVERSLERCYALRAAISWSLLLIRPRIGALSLWLAAPGGGELFLAVLAGWGTWTAARAGAGPPAGASQDGAPR